MSLRVRKVGMALDDGASGWIVMLDGVDVDEGPDVDARGAGVRVDMVD
jgi:hypothetical protein